MGFCHLDCKMNSEHDYLLEEEVNDFKAFTKAERSAREAFQEKRLRKDIPLGNNTSNTTNKAEN